MNERGRRDPEAQHGVVKIPDDNRYHDSGEGGLAYYAAFNTVSDRITIDSASAAVLNGIMNVPPLVGYPYDHPAANEDEEIAFLIHENHQTQLRHNLGHIEGLVYLGSHGGSWGDKSTGTYFVPDKDDLTEDGRGLVESLELLYGEDAMFFSVLDT